MDWSKVGHEMYDWWNEGNGPQVNVGKTSFTPTAVGANYKDIYGNTRNLALPDYEVGNWESFGRAMYNSPTWGNLYKQAIMPNTGSATKTFDTGGGNSYANSSYSAYAPNTPVNYTNLTYSNTGPVRTPVGTPSTTGSTVNTGGSNQRNAKGTVPTVVTYQGTNYTLNNSDKQFYYGNQPTGIYSDGHNNLVYEGNVIGGWDSNNNAYITDGNSNNTGGGGSNTAPPPQNNVGGAWGSYNSPGYGNGSGSNYRFPTNTDDPEHNQMSLAGRGGNVSWEDVSPEDFYAAMHAGMGDFPTNPYTANYQQAIDTNAQIAGDFINRYDNMINTGAFNEDAYRLAAQDQINRNAKRISNQTLGQLARRGQVSSSVGAETLGGNVNRYLGDSLQNLEKDIQDRVMTDRGANLQALAQEGALASQLGNNWASGYSNLANQWQNSYNANVGQYQNLMQLYNTMQNDNLMRNVTFQDFLNNWIDTRDEEATT